ncbi:hypothetical protein DSO57_1012421 [Entomophthora muscae]|uniref:Uncharacterized protein n=1 Tax=Entomophthora muscae TaxID=34485 RepID=A0ACC2URQ0_9FUNG|nr:hypothetical protein DSO57_1012421 [Entomophthora muscae]
MKASLVILLGLPFLFWCQKISSTSARTKFAPALFLSGPNSLGGFKNAGISTKVCRLHLSSSSSNDLDYPQDLWEKIFHYAHYVGDSSSHLLYLFEDLHGQAQDMLVTEENLFKSLTCDDLEYLPLSSDLPTLLKGDLLVSPLSWKLIPLSKRKGWVPRSTLPGGLPGCLVPCS